MEGKPLKSLRALKVSCFVSSVVSGSAGIYGKATRVGRIGATAADFARSVRGAAHLTSAQQRREQQHLAQPPAAEWEHCHRGRTYRGGPCLRGPQESKRTACHRACR